MTPQEYQAQIDRLLSIVQLQQENIATLGTQITVLAGLVESGRQDLLDCRRALQDCQNS